MFRRFAAGLAVAVVLGAPAQAADVPYSIMLDGRPLTAHGTASGAISRDGVLFIDVVVATKTFSGLLTFADHGSTVRLSLRHRTAIFKVGKLTAEFDGKPRKLAGAPFKSSGDIYVPLLAVARLGGATLVVDRANQTARLGVRPFASIVEPPPAPVAASSASAAVLTLTPSSSVDAQGVLHVQLDVTNATGAPVSLEFPNGGRVAFLVNRAGTLVWDSTHGRMFTMMVGFQTLAPHEKISFDATWPQYASQPAGAYELTARLLLRSPIVSPAVPVPAAPHPAAS